MHARHILLPLHDKKPFMRGLNRSFSFAAVRYLFELAQSKEIDRWQVDGRQQFVRNRLWLALKCSVGILEIYKEFFEHDSASEWKSQQKRSFHSFREHHTSVQRTLWLCERPLRRREEANMRPHISNFIIRTASNPDKFACVHSSTEYKTVGLIKPATEHEYWTVQAMQDVECRFNDFGRAFRVGVTHTEYRPPSLMSGGS